MTIDQSKTIEILRRQFEENCKSYVEFGSERTCSFSIYESTVEGDDNITTMITTIDGLSDDYQPYIKTANVLIEPDGTHFNLYDIFPASKVVSYVEKLKKLA